jgi:hypothetical protein
LKNKSHIRNNSNEVIHAISVMDIDLLDSVLDRNLTYQDTTKAIFIKSLEVIFENFRSEDSFLIPHKGRCISDECPNTNKNGISFTGNVSEDYLNLILETDKENTVTDIYECYSFCPASFKFDPSKRDYSIKIYEDEKVTFEPGEAYELLNTTAQKAVNELLLFDNATIPFDYIKLWEAQYKNLSSVIKLNYTLKNYHIFNKYYDRIKSICDLAELETEAKKAVTEYYNLHSNDELEILKWLIKYELLNDDIGYSNYTLNDDEVLSSAKRKLHPDSNISFQLSFLEYYMKFHDIFSSMYSSMLDKYSTLTEEEKKNTHLLSNDQIDLAYNLSHHLKKRGMI